MKTIRNLIIVCLLVIATIIVTPKVFAAIADGDATGSIQVNGVESGVTATAYRLMTVKITNGQPQDPVYTWVDSVATWMGQNGYGDWVGTNNAVKDSFNDEDLTDEPSLAEFYDKLAAAIKSNEITGLESKSATAGDDKIATITDVKMGNHLILVENGMRVYKPLSANVVPKNTSGEWNIENGKIETTRVETKSSEPTISKTVAVSGTSQSLEEIQAMIGTRLTYTIDADVVQYPENAIYKNLKITDTLTSGLTLKGDTIVVYGRKGNTDTKLFEADSNLVTVDGNTFAVEFKTADYESYLEGTYDKVIVTYDAIINKDAVIIDDENTNPEKNTARLEYNNNPYTGGDYDTHTDDIVKVFTYGIKINKKGVGDDANGLAGAKFKITDADGNVIKFVQDSAGVYHVAITDEGVLEAGAVDEVVTPTGGELVLNGLAAGTYYAEETFAPNDYVKLQGKLTFTITAETNDNGELTGIAIGENDKTTGDGYLENDVTNKKGITLPVTGGIGTLIFSIIGVLFMGISIVLIRNILKKKEVQL